MLEAFVQTDGNAAVGIVYEGEEVFGSNFGQNAADILQSFRRMFPSENVQVAAKPSPFAKKALSTVRDVYDGKGASELISINVDRFPAFSQRVLRAVARVPVGYVVSYGGVADAVGGGPRAVGNVMAGNCFAPLVPCHRVVTSNLGLGGYGGGGGSLRTKFEFLKREKHGYKESKDISTEGGLMRVFPVEIVLTKLEKSGIFGCT